MLNVRCQTETLSTYTYIEQTDLHATCMQSPAPSFVVNCNTSKTHGVGLDTIALSSLDGECLVGATVTLRFSGASRTSSGRWFSYSWKELIEAGSRGAG